MLKQHKSMHKRMQHASKRWSERNCVSEGYGDLENSRESTQSLHFNTIRLMWMRLGKENIGKQWESRKWEENWMWRWNGQSKGKKESEWLKTEHMWLCFLQCVPLSSLVTEKNHVWILNKVTPVVRCLSTIAVWQQPFCVTVFTRSLFESSLPGGG